LHCTSQYFSRWWRVFGELVLFVGAVRLGALRGEQALAALPQQLQPCGTLRIRVCFGGDTFIKLNHRTITSVLSG